MLFEEGAKLDKSEKSKFHCKLIFRCVLTVHVKDIDQLGLQNQMNLPLLFVKKRKSNEAKMKRKSIQKYIKDGNPVRDHSHGLKVNQMTKSKRGK